MGVFSTKVITESVAKLTFAEQMATINEAQSKLEKLSGTKKKGLFNRIF